MLILHLESPNRGHQGDHVYRTRQPCRALGELEGVTVVSGSLLTPAIHGLVDEAEVLVLCDVVDADFLPIIEARRRRRRLTAYEINDHFLAPQPWNPTAYLAANLISRSLSSQLARHSDCLQLTVDQLGRRFGHLNARRAIFANQLWDPPATAARRRAAPGGRVRIGWGGSVGHREDIKWVIPVLRGTLSRHPEVTLAIMGDPSLRDLFAWVPRGQFEFTTGGNIDAYRSFVGGLQIGLGPLLPTEFNRCRSDVKFLEYTAGGALAICSQLEPYAQTIRDGENGRLFRDLDELDGAIERDARAARRARRDGEAGGARAGDRAARARPRARSPGLLPVDGRGAGVRARRAHPRRRPRAPTPTRRPARARSTARATSPSARARSSGCCTRGWSCSRRATPTRRAGASPRRSAWRRPSTWPTCSWPASSRAPRPRSRALRRAEELSPRSCNVAFLIGAHLQARGDLQGAIAAFERCRQIAPSFGAAQCRLGELAEARRAGSRRRAICTRTPRSATAPSRCRWRAWR